LLVNGLGSKQCDPVTIQIRATFKILTTAHQLDTRWQEKLACSLSPILARRRCPSPTKGTHPNPLSLSPIKGGDGWRFFPFAKVSTAAYSSPASRLLRHLVFPCTQIILTSYLSFCHGLHHHRATAPSSTADHKDNFYRCR
jgi:hypothetical protein